MPGPRTSSNAPCRIIPVYSNLGFVFVILAVILLSNHNVTLSKLIAEMWEHGDITKKKTDVASKTSRQVSHKPPGYQNLLDQLYLLSLSSHSFPVQWGIISNISGVPTLIFTAI